MKIFFVDNLIKQVFFSAVLVFAGSYFFFSNVLPSPALWKISAENPLQYQFLSQVLGTVEAADDLLRMELRGGGGTEGGGTSLTSFTCPSGGTAIQYSHNTGNNDRGYWFECYASRAAAAGYIPMTRLDGAYFSGPLRTGGSAPPGTIGGFNGAGFWCESGSHLAGYNIYSVSNDWRATWYACESDTPVPVALIDNASCSGITGAPATVTPGQSFSASITMSNTGSTTWSSAANYNLGSQNPQDNTRWGYDRVSLPHSVSPGGSVTFSKTFTAPASPGTYPFDWKMVHDGVAWFPGGTCSQNITVAASPPPPPSSVNGSCNAGGVSVSWAAVTGANSYAVRVDKYRDGIKTCPSSTGQEDLCGIVNTTSAYYMPSVSPYADYDAWVHSCANTDGTNCSTSATHVLGSLFTCSATTYSCTGSVPANANLCSGDDTGLTANTPRTAVSSCTSGTKCEYVCASGYVLSGSSCVLAGGGGPPAPTLIFNASPTSLPFGGGTTRLTWTTSNVSGSCLASGAWSGSKTGSSSFQDIPLSMSGTYTFNLECWNSASVSTGVKSATVTVASGSGGTSADLRINGQNGPYPTPVSVAPNSAVTVSWTSSGVAYCGTSIFDGGWKFIQGTSGNYSFTAPSVSTPAEFQTLCNNSVNYSNYIDAANNATTFDKEIMTVSAGGPYSCTGTIPPNASMYPNDNVGLSADTPYSYWPTNTGTRCQYSCNTGFTWDGTSCAASGGPSSASVTANVICTITGNCAADPRTTQLCSGQTFTIPDGCDGTMTCPGTRSCNYNWREVAP